MLREGFLRCLQRTPLSRISVSELSKESGINRATFYNHYDSPSDLMKEIAYEYADELSSIYHENFNKDRKKQETAIMECLQYLYARKDEIKLLFSKNAENTLSGYAMEIITENLINRPEAVRDTGIGDYNDSLLYAVLTSSAAFGLIQVWISMDIDKTPEDILKILRHAMQH